ncbi:YdcF family protein [Leuconostoc citreum]
MAVKKNKYRVLCGFILLLSMMAFFCFTLNVVSYLDNPLVTRIYTILITICVIPLCIFLVCWQIVFIWNGILVLRKENVSIANLLTLLIGTFSILGGFFYTALKSVLGYNQFLEFFRNTLISCQLYIFILAIAFLCSSFLIKMVRLNFDKDYIIVLGSGLINGKVVSNLLASRILIAKKFKEQQLLKTNKNLFLIMTGGKGSDEEVSEADAMKDYALSLGVAKEDILTETFAENTYQNMLYSKELLIQHKIDVNKGLFATNDYHVFRAGIYARKVGLQIDGLGSKTRKYFLPNALIREYIAFYLRYKKIHVVIFALIIMLNCLIFIR